MKRTSLIVMGLMVITTFLWSTPFLWTLVASFRPDGGGGIGMASLVPDYVPEKSRSLAMSVLTCGNFVGTGVAMLLGGELVQWATKTKPVVPFLGAIASWKVSFLGVGLPGLLLALLIFVTLREPKRKLTASAVDSETPTLKDCFDYLRQSIMCAWEALKRDAAD